MPFQRLGRDAIDRDRKLLHLGEVNRQGIDEGGKDQSFALGATGKMLNGFAAKIDGGGRAIDGNRGGAAGQWEEGKESCSRIFAQGQEEILQAGRFIRAGRALLDDTGKAAAIGEGVKEADHPPGVFAGRDCGCRRFSAELRRRRGEKEPVSGKAESESAAGNKDDTPCSRTLCDWSRWTT